MEGCYCQINCGKCRFSCIWCNDCTKVNCDMPNQFACTLTDLCNIGGEEFVKD